MTSELCPRHRSSVTGRCTIFLRVIILYVASHLTIDFRIPFLSSLVPRHGSIVRRAFAVLGSGEDSKNPGVSLFVSFRERSRWILSSDGASRAISSGSVLAVASLTLICACVWGVAHVMCIRNFAIYISSRWPTWTMLIPLEIYARDEIFQCDVIGRKGHKHMLAGVIFRWY